MSYYRGRGNSGGRGRGRDNGGRYQGGRESYKSAGRFGGSNRNVLSSVEDEDEDNFIFEIYTNKIETTKFNNAKCRCR